MDAGQSKLSFLYTDHQRVAEEDVTDQVRAARRKTYLYRPDFEDRQEKLENHYDEYQEEDDADGMDFAVRERSQYDPVEDENNGEEVDNQDDRLADVLDEKGEEDDNSSENEEEDGKLKMKILIAKKRNIPTVTMMTRIAMRMMIMVVEAKMPMSRREHVVVESRSNRVLGNTLLLIIISSI